MLTPAERFFEQLGSMNPCRVLEMGTLAWNGPPKHSRDLVLKANPAADWTGCDMVAGEGVDLVCDIHNLSSLNREFDAAVVCSVLEHVARPWVAAQELGSVIRSGGILLVTTHQSFPYHAYPKDYYRFTQEGLREIFSEEAGWKVVESNYDHPCKVTPLDNFFTHAHDWNFEAEAWLSVSCLAERI